MKPDVTKLIQRLDTASDKKADLVIAQICQMGSPAIPELLKAAKNREAPRIRKWSLQALGALGAKRATPLLVEALLDDRMTVRLHALKGLGRIGDQRTVKKITPLLKDQSGGIRVNALYALMEIGDASVGASVISSLKDPAWYVRQTACEACGVFRLLKSKRKLSQLAKEDERKAVRKAAEAALAKL